MTKFSKIFSLLFFSFLMTNFAQAQSLDKILSNYFENIGGVEKWKSFNSMKITGSTEAMGMSFGIVVYSKRPNKQLVEVDVQGMKIVEAYDGETAWAINPMAGGTEPAKKTEAEAKEQGKQMFEDEFIDYKDKGHTVTLEGKEDLQGTEVFKIKLVTKAGDEKFYFFDTENFVPIMVKAFVAEGQMKGQTIEMYFSDYQETGSGVIVAHSIEQKVGGQTMMSMSAEKIEFDVDDISDSDFAFPNK